MKGNICASFKCKHKNMEVELKQNERIDDLEYKNLKIIQNKLGFCFGIDSVLLSDFAKNMKKANKVLDLGTGTGILPILLSAKMEVNKIVGIEIQKDVVDMAKRSILLNNLQEKIEIVEADIKNYIPEHNFDMVISNPPYQKKGTGKENDAETKLISKHEITATLTDFIKVAYEALNDQGCLYMVHHPERLVDILSELRKQKLEPKELKFIYPNKHKAPNLVLIKAVKYAKPFLKVLEPLYIYEDEQVYSKEVLKIYNK